MQLYVLHCKIIYKLKRIKLCPFLPFEMFVVVHLSEWSYCTYINMLYIPHNVTKVYTTRHAHLGYRLGLMLYHRSTRSTIRVQYQVYLVFTFSLWNSFLYSLYVNIPHRTSIRTYALLRGAKSAKSAISALFFNRT